MNKFGMDESIPLEAGIVSRAIENSKRELKDLILTVVRELLRWTMSLTSTVELYMNFERRLCSGRKMQKRFENWFLAQLEQYSDFDAEKTLDTFCKGTH